MKVIGLCGRAGAGKSTVVATVGEIYPTVQFISPGDATRRLLRSRKVEINHHNLQAITKEILAARGNDYISFMFELINPKSQFVLIDSFRRVQDIECVTRTFGAPIVISVLAPEEIRFKRLVARARASDALDEASFNDLKALEDSWGVDIVYAGAEAVINRLRFPNPARLHVSSRRNPKCERSFFRCAYRDDAIAL